MKNLCRKMTAIASIGAVMLTTVPTGIVHAHDNGVGKTPPMGWSSWNAFWEFINEDAVVKTVDSMVKSGLKDAGYVYVNIDDTWQAAERDENGRMQFDSTKFPNGGKWLADYCHKNGLKMGLYSSNGLYTCYKDNLPGSQFNEITDAETWAEWGIDYLKYDYCHNVDLSTTAYGIYGISVAKSSADPITYVAENASLTGTAQITTDGSNKKYIDGLGEDKGTATFTVETDESGEYTVSLDTCAKALNETVTEENGVNTTPRVPMFISINGDDKHPYIMILDESSAANLTLNAGTNTLTFYNPIRKGYEDYDTARYMYAFMGDCLMNATESYAKKTGKQERPILFSICEWGERQPWLWGGEVGNIWRTTGDIDTSWSKIMQIYDVNVNLYKYAGRYGKAEDDNNYGWNDPDMLEVGNGSLTNDENIAHFSLWCQMAAPLILGNDLRGIENRKRILDILTNKDAISINQDATAIQGIKVKDDGDTEYLIKPLSGGKISLLMFNRADTVQQMSISIPEIGTLVKNVDEYYYNNYYKLAASEIYHLKDVWQKNGDGSNVEFDTASVTVNVPSHGVKMYIVEPMVDVKKGSAISASVEKKSLAAKEATTLTATFTNGTVADAKSVKIDLILPFGFTATAKSAEQTNNVGKGGTFTVEYEISSGALSIADVPILINANIIYNGYEGSKKFRDVKILSVK